MTQSIDVNSASSKANRNTLYASNFDLFSDNVAPLSKRISPQMKALIKRGQYLNVSQYKLRPAQKSDRYNNVSYSPPVPIRNKNYFTKNKELRNVTIYSQ